jgi:hypothetical protein
MQQFLHLLIVDRDGRQGLAAVHGSRWLLPVIRSTERTRAGPLAVRWIAEHGLAGHVIGQWLGRLSPANNAMDWLVIVDARPARSGVAPPGMRWTPLERLQSSASLLDYQQWTLTKAVPDDLPRVAGPFGSMTWFDDVRAWLTVVAGLPIAPPICYKATPYEVVLGIETASGPVYFKGLSGDRVAEATLTSTLAGELPRSFARTLMLERRADSVWWLTAHCSGTTLAAGLTRERTLRAAANLARVQRHLSGLTMGCPVLEGHLTAAAAWGRALLLARSDAAAVDSYDEALARIDRTVNDADLPRSWIPLDLDAGNVLIDDESVRFIDLDRSYVGSVPLALSTLLRRLRRADSVCPLWVDAVHHAYERSWTPCLALRERWPDFETASLLLECHMGWRQLQQKSERGEVSGALDLAASHAAQRLARAFDGRGDTGSTQGSR